jgi:hypothetical protein
MSPYTEGDPSSIQWDTMISFFEFHLFAFICSANFPKIDKALFSWNYNLRLFRLYYQN